MSRTNHFLTCLMTVLFFHAATAALAEETGVRQFPLPGHGSLQLDVPASWKDDVEQPPNQLPPTIRFEPKSGTPFEVVITPSWPPKKDTSPPSAEEMKRQVRLAAERVRPEAVEETIDLLELKGASGPGYYFSVTDRAPKPDEYRFMTEGVIRVGDLMVTFTILSNDGQSHIVSDALAMLKGAVHSIIPSKAGIRSFQVGSSILDTRFRGYDDFLQWYQDGLPIHSNRFFVSHAHGERTGKIV